MPDRPLHRDPPIRGSLRIRPPCPPRHEPIPRRSLGRLKRRRSLSSRGDRRYEWISIPNYVGIPLQREVVKFAHLRTLEQTAIGKYGSDTARPLTNASTGMVLTYFTSSSLSRIRKGRFCQTLHESLYKLDRPLLAFQRALIASQTMNIGRWVHDRH